MNHHIHKARLAASVLVLTVILAACQMPSWELGHSYGWGTEPAAARASLMIYRQPRLDLYDLWQAKGVGPVADAIYASAAGPLSKVPTICLNVAGIKVCAGGPTVDSLARQEIYGRETDIKNALQDATDNFDCLAFTFFSYGDLVQNWTHKGYSTFQPCYIGSWP